MSEFFTTWFPATTFLQASYWIRFTISIGTVIACRKTQRHGLVGRFKTVERAIYDEPKGTASVRHNLLHHGGRSYDDCQCG
jgi:hypothetical protein